MPNLITLLIRSFHFNILTFHASLHKLDVTQEAYPNIWDTFVRKNLKRLIQSHCYLDLFNLISLHLIQVCASWMLRRRKWLQIKTLMKSIRETETRGGRGTTGRGGVKLSQTCLNVSICCQSRSLFVYFHPFPALA